MPIARAICLLSLPVITQRMTSFSRGDYNFDVSLHAMDGLDPGGLTHGWFQELDIYRRLKPVRLDPMYQAYFPGFALNVPADVELIVWICCRCRI